MHDTLSALRRTATFATASAPSTAATGATVVTVEEESNYIKSLVESAEEAEAAIKPPTNAAQSQTIGEYRNWVAGVQAHEMEWQASIKSELIRLASPLPYTLWINSWASDTSRLFSELEGWKAKLVDVGVVPASKMPKTKKDEPKSWWNSAFEGDFGLSETVIHPVLKIAAIAGIGYLSFLYVSKKVEEGSFKNALGKLEASSAAPAAPRVEVKQLPAKPVSVEAELVER
jgi:hypothetical protein